MTHLDGKSPANNFFGGLRACCSDCSLKKARQVFRQCEQYVAVVRSWREAVCLEILPLSAKPRSLPQEISPRWGIYYIVTTGSNGVSRPSPAGDARTAKTCHGITNLNTTHCSRGEQKPWGYSPRACTHDEIAPLSMRT